MKFLWDFDKATGNVLIKLLKLENFFNELNLLIGNFSINKSFNLHHEFLFDFESFFHPLKKT